MLTTDTFEKALDLLELGYTFPAITEETGITTEDAEAVHVAWFNGTSEQVIRELQLAGVLEAAATKVRSGQGWDESQSGRPEGGIEKMRYERSSCSHGEDVDIEAIRRFWDAMLTRVKAYAEAGRPATDATPHSMPFTHANEEKAQDD